MADTTTITDAGIAVMCDVARLAGADVPRDRQDELHRLIAAGFVEQTNDRTGAPVYVIAPKGQRVLDERGVGVNEA